MEILDKQLSDEYYHSRPIGSQIGAWASPQSEVINNRSFLENNVREFEEKFKDQNPIPRPPYWGGYIVKADYFEFWQGRTSRLHDRIRYRISENEQWTVERLAP